MGDDTPTGIITPTSPDTLLEDMQEIIFAKARHAVRAIRQEAVANGTAEWTVEDIDEEIRQARLARQTRKR